MSHIWLRSELRKTEHLPSRVTVAEHLVEMEQGTMTVTRLMIHSSEGYDVVELQPDDPLGLGFVHRLFMQTEILNPVVSSLQAISLHSHLPPALMHLGQVERSPQSRVTRYWPGTVTRFKGRL